MTSEGYKSFQLLLQKATWCLNRHTMYMLYTEYLSKSSETSEGRVH